MLWREGLLTGRQAAAIGIGGPLAIGTSRGYLDVHGATDVLGGWGAGALVSALGAVVYERVRRDTRERGRVVRRIRDSSRRMSSFDSRSLP